MFCKEVNVIKKTFFIIILSFVLIFSLCVFDYCVNKKEIEASVFKVKGKDMQESFSFSGNVEKSGNINYIKGYVTEPLKIKEGAQADVYFGEKYYEGYLQKLQKTNSRVFEAWVSVIADEELTGTGEATVFGDVDKNVIIIPDSCIFTDENGKDSVMVVTQGYCAKRNVELGKIKTKNGRQVKKGIFGEEKVIIEPKGIKTGDKIKEN